MFLFFLAMVLLTPAFMTFFGLLWLKKPPRKINMAYGYRTERSMKNRQTWDFAHKYSGRIWAFTGIPAFVLSAFVMFICKENSIDEMAYKVIIIVAVQIVLLCLPLIPTEMALRDRFDINGKVKKK